MGKFNLVTEPWLPVLLVDGRTDLVGLADLYKRAHEIRLVYGEHAMETLALLRLIVVIAHRSEPIRDADHWETLWSRGRFDTTVQTYLQTWAHRFNLLDD